LPSSSRGHLFFCVFFFFAWSSWHLHVFTSASSFVFLHTSHTPYSRDTLDSHTCTHPSQDWLDPSLQRNHLSDEELLHTASTIDWSQHFIPNIELLDAVDYTIIGGDGSGMIMPRLRPKDHKTKECNHCTMSVKYSATMKSRFDFRHFPFEKQILQLSMKTLSISDGIRFQNGKTNGFVQRKCIYIHTYMYIIYIHIIFFSRVLLLQLNFHFHFHFHLCFLSIRSLYDTYV